jgi:FtsZ-binding cell division protein ZapB
LNKTIRLLLPVELQRANHTASTNILILTHNKHYKSYNIAPMPEIHPLDQIHERVERLILRHAELQRDKATLEAQVLALTHERNSLKSRLNAARARIDALLDRLTSSSKPHETN